MAASSSAARASGSFDASHQGRVAGSPHRAAPTACTAVGARPVNAPAASTAAAPATNVLMRSTIHLPPPPRPVAMVARLTVGGPGRGRRRYSRGTNVVPRSACDTIRTARAAAASRRPSRS